ncbi:hypothetical protein KIN20_010629 [Parelaphostrongylus tenuis]|uniref:SCP domain-containing protein n=1 Tax=Parelaphostrongylus tenuis TaxID=148309 RepID=A0AAD5MZ88_PARTN|nr:hypothetical protein KIN20_010629 [Parelaphostrongylus tenuis]
MRTSTDLIIFRDLQDGEQVYRPGNSCRNGDECFRPELGVCEDGLCIIAMNTSTTVAPTNTTTTTSSSSTTTTTTTPTTTTTTPTTTTTTTPTTTTTTTSTRRRSTDCASTAFSTTFREVALGMHNNFRSLVATGRARNGEYPNENAPPASRMDLMEYDCQAEQLALSHAGSCDRRELPPFARPGYSENIHILDTAATDLLGAIQNVVRPFYAVDFTSLLACTVIRKALTGSDEDVAAETLAIEF